MSDTGHPLALVNIFFYQAIKYIIYQAIKILCLFSFSHIHDKLIALKGGNLTHFFIISVAENQQATYILIKYQFI